MTALSRQCICSRNLGVVASWISLLLFFVGSACYAQERWNVISWVGNTPDWNQRLGVTELRLSCSGTPARCLQGVRYHSNQQGVGYVTLAMRAPPERMLEYAREYAEGSRAEPRLRAIGLDDFAQTLRKWDQLPNASEPAQLLADLIRIIRSNPALKFAITLYEDELSSKILNDEQLPPELRRQIDRVSLYLHYRGNGRNYQAYVRQVHRLFPNAEVIAGVYAYDRSDYLPCMQGSRAKCSAEQETRLFAQTLKEQIGLLAEGEISGLEFYPGFFGKESEWSGWTHPRGCRPERRAECVELTIRMRQNVLESLQQMRSIQRGQASN